MKIPKYMPMLCVNRCPNVEICFYGSTPKNGRICVLRHNKLQTPLYDLIQILEVENEDT